MTRLPDWRTRLYRYFAEVGRREFSWSDWHCGHFVLGAVEAQTGVLLDPDVPGRATTGIGATRVLRKAGFADVAELTASLLPETDRPTEGDIAVMLDADGRLALGVMGRGCVHCLSPGMGLWASYEPHVKAFSVSFSEAGSGQ